MKLSAFIIILFFLSAGIDGNNCILHTICETVDKVAPRKGIIEEIFRLVFT